MGAARRPARARKWAWRGLLISLTLFGFAQIGSGFYIHAKAALAQEMLERAWGETQADGVPHKAWSWADTWPVARLTFPKHGVDLVVLEGTSGEALAFGPGRMPAFARLGQPGTAIIAAHRDTHFRFLEKVETGDEFWIETTDGTRHRYAVVDTAILDSRTESIGSDPAGSSLVLLTCYPFDSLAVGGPLRYLVFAENADRA
jgi:sortase A